MNFVLFYYYYYFIYLGFSQGFLLKCFFFLLSIVSSNGKEKNYDVLISFSAEFIETIPNVLQLSIYIFTPVQCDEPINTGSRLPSPSLPAIGAGRIRLNLDSVSNTFGCFFTEWGLGRGIRMRRGGAHSLSLVRDTIAPKNSESRDNQPLFC